MQTKQETTQYYIVLQPFFIETASLSNEAGIKWLFENVPPCITRKNFVSVFTDKEQAKFAASQFSSREVPAEARQEAYRDICTLAKPILCLSLDAPLNLTKKNTGFFIIDNKQIQSQSYQIPTQALGQWQEANWSVLINDLELTRPEHIENCEEKHSSLGM